MATRAGAACTAILPCLGCWPTASLRADRGEMVRGCPAPEMAAAEGNPGPPQADRGRACLTSELCISVSYWPSWPALCHPIGGRECPPHVSCTDCNCFQERNPFLGRAPALLDCGADGPSLSDPGLQPRGWASICSLRAGVAPAHSSPCVAPTSHLLRAGPVPRRMES